LPRLVGKVLHERPGLRVARVSCDGDDRCPGGAEAADADQLVVVLRGRFSFRDRRRRLVLEPSIPVTFEAGRPFEIRHFEGGGDECLAVTGGPAERWLGLSGRTPRLDAAAQAALLRLARVLSSPVPPPALAAEEALWTALAPPGDRPPRTASRRDRTVAAALTEALVARSGEPLTLDAVAAAAEISVFHACRVFRRVEGTTLHRRLTELRLRHALALVLDTGWSFGRIAAEAGFANQGHLGNAFRRRYGQTPGAVRAGAGVIP
jgi:AraC-like DNA-binding protein